MFLRRQYTWPMKVGKLIKVGDSIALVIPRSHLRKLGWFRGDFVTQEVLEAGILLKNMREHLVKPMHTRAEYGDALGK